MSGVDGCLHRDYIFLDDLKLHLIKANGVEVLTVIINLRLHRETCAALQVQVLCYYNTLKPCYRIFHFITKFYLHGTLRGSGWHVGGDFSVGKQGNREPPANSAINFLQ